MTQIKRQIFVVIVMRFVFNITAAEFVSKV